MCVFYVWIMKFCDDVQIGGASNPKVSEKKDIDTDALNDTKAAVVEGIILGKLVNTFLVLN